MDDDRIFRLKRSFFLTCTLFFLASPSFPEENPYNLQFGYEISSRMGAGGITTSYIPGRITFQTLLPNGSTLHIADSFYNQTSSTTGINSHNLQLDYDRSLTHGLNMHSILQLRTYTDGMTPANQNNNAQFGARFTHTIDPLTNFNYNLSLETRSYQNNGTANYSQQQVEVQGSRHLHYGIDKFTFGGGVTNNAAATTTGSFSDIRVHTEYDRALSMDSHVRIYVEQSNHQSPSNAAGSYAKTQFSIGNEQRLGIHNQLHSQLAYTSDTYPQAMSSSNILNLTSVWRNKLAEALDLQLNTGYLTRQFPVASGSNYQRLDVMGNWNWLAHPAHHFVFRSGYSSATYNLQTQSYNSIQLGLDWLTPFSENWQSRLSDNSSIDTFPVSTANNLSRHNLSWEITNTFSDKLRRSITTSIDLFSYQTSTVTQSSYYALSGGMNLDYKIDALTSVKVSTRVRGSRFQSAPAQDFATLFVQGSLNYVF